MRKARKIGFVAATLLALVPVWSAQGEKAASPAPDDPRIVNPPCPPGQKGHPRIPDMRLWDAVLKEHVRRGIVDYRAIQKDDRFRRFMAQWDCTDMRAVEKLEGATRTAFWVNLYNAGVVALVLNHFPIPSPMNVENFYLRRAVRLGGHLAALNHFRDEAERLPEARVGFALCTGMLGSPPLRSEAYTAERLDEQLEEQTRRFIANPKNVWVDHRRNHLRLAETFRTHQFSIERDHKSVLLFIAGYLRDNDAKAVASGKMTLQFVMDTDLNGEGAY